MVISMDRWVGKVAIVTGASAGIGVEIARLLVEQGLQVVGLARRVELVEKLAKDLAGKKGKLHAIKADIGKEDDILNAFKWVKNNLGPVHILVNNAGLLQPTNLVEGNTEMWQKIIDVNVIGLCIATREAVKDMRANNIDGHIIHIGSISGQQVNYFSNASVYHASKFAVRALTETLRQELNAFKTKIKITCVSPGVVKTDIVVSNNIGEGTELANLLKLQPSLDAVDVADAVIYALSTPPHVQIHELTIKPINEVF